MAEISEYQLVTPIAMWKPEKSRQRDAGDLSAMPVQTKAKVSALPLLKMPEAVVLAATTHPEPGKCRLQAEGRHGTTADTAEIA